MRTISKQFIIGAVTCMVLPFVNAGPEQLPLATKDTILAAYQGSFKIDYSDSVSSTDYARGRVAYNPEKNSVYIDSHVYQLAVAEFAIPATLSTSSDKGLLPKAQNLQPFTRVLAKVTNSERLDRIGGMSVIGGKLFVQGFVVYDGAGTVSDTTLVLDDPSDLKNTTASGFYKMDGAARTVNYLSPVPSEWVSVLGGTWIAGNGAGMSISSRLSEGPSLYAFNPSDIADKNITTKEWLNYPVNFALSVSNWQDYSVSGYGAWDVYNTTLRNDMWTDESAAWFGFIVPGTRTFAVFGRSGMLKGGGYKITNSAGYTCSGACPSDPTDTHSYYWLYDLNDIVSAKNSFDPLPYEYGIFDDKFMAYNNQGGMGYPTGGSFDIKSGTLVLSHRAATSNHESGHPVLSVYKFSPGKEYSPPKTPSNILIQ